MEVIFLIVLTIAVFAVSYIPIGERVSESFDEQCNREFVMAWPVVMSWCVWNAIVENWTILMEDCIAKVKKCTENEEDEV